MLFFQALLMNKLIFMIKKHTWNKIQKIKNIPDES